MGKVLLALADKVVMGKVLRNSGRGPMVTVHLPFDGQGGNGQNPPSFDRQGGNGQGPPPFRTIRQVWASIWQTDLSIVEIKYLCEDFDKSTCTKFDDAIEQHWNPFAGLGS
jgi:hypothetical protein